MAKSFRSMNTTKELALLLNNVESPYNDHEDDGETIGRIMTEGEDRIARVASQLKFKKGKKRPKKP